MIVGLLSKDSFEVDVDLVAIRGSSCSGSGGGGSSSVASSAAESASL